MKNSIILFTFSLFSSLTLLAQDEEDTIKPIRAKYFTITPVYLYSYFQRSHTVAFWWEMPPVYFVRYTPVSTSGFSLDCSRRKEYGSHFSWQYGLGFTFHAERDIYQDSTHNAAGSLLHVGQESHYNLSANFAINYRLGRFTLLSGIVFPLVSLEYNFFEFEDHSKSGTYNWEWVIYIGLKAFNINYGQGETST
ncbi:MAG TPA: hypothetical protein VNZ86_18225 [Bacteroidia bacterium]|jgi:hypothetical protein|nr:hypothetical protein [Bacteroidia bacterium]